MHILTAGRMKYRRARALLIALALVFASFLIPSGIARAESDGMVRVRLTRLGAPNAVTMRADCDYYLASDPSVRVPAGDRVTISAEGDGLQLSTGSARVSLGGSARLMRAGEGNQGAQFLQPELSNRFCGDLGFSVSGGVISTVLNIYIENYLYGVVGCEMAPSSGIEALKAQAVAARTYAMRRKATRADAAYDLTDTTADQVFRGYNGASDYANVIKAVDDTRGGVLYYGNSLAQCYYSASNGGQTESTKNAWGTALDYTVVKDDPYDLESAATVKSAVINKDLTGMHASLKSALVASLAEQLAALNLSTAPSDVRVNAIEGITACEPRFAAPSRLYKALTFQLSVTGVTADGAAKTGTLSVSIPTYGAFESWYELSINQDDNETVWVAETDRAFTVSFRRFGHGVGMSQRGAQVMAADYGMRMAEILEFYYPGTEGRRLELADASRDKKVIAPQPEQSVIATARLSGATDLLDAADGNGAATATVAAGAVVDVYAVQGEWAAVGSGGRYGFVKTDDMESFSLTGSTVTRPETAVYGTAREAAQVLRLPVRQSAAISSVDAGVVVQVLAWTEDWAMVEAPDGPVGFVPLGALDIDRRQAAGPGAAAEAEQAAEPEVMGEVSVIEADDDLYGQLRQDSALYARDNLLSDALDMLYQGSLVKIIAYNSEWARVRTRSSQEGYIPLSCLTAVDGAQLALSGDDAADSEAIDGGGIQRVSGRKYLYVSVDAAPVYASWSTEAEIIGTLDAGTRVQLGAYNDRWACVRLPGAEPVTGYMLMSALAGQVSDGAGDDAISRAPAGTYAAAARQGVPVYRSYSESSDRIAELDSGERVEVGAYSAEWALVRFDGMTGYVKLKDLERVS